MASDGISVNAGVQAPPPAPVAKISPTAQVAQAKNTAQAARVVPGDLPAATSRQHSGKTLPASGVYPAPSAAPSSAQTKTTGANPAAKPIPDLHALTAQVNKHLQESGRPTQFRLDSSTGRAMIQEINPDTGEVVGELPESEFKGLAQGLTQESGVSGLLVDTRA